MRPHHTVPFRGTKEIYQDKKCIISKFKEHTNPRVSTENKLYKNSLSLLEKS